MGKAVSKLKHPFRNYNIENRAHKVISRDKPVPAPKYPSDVADYERLLKTHPEIVQETTQKHEALDINLKTVYVTSEDPAPRIVSAPTDGPNRPLPTDKKIVPDFLFGYKEPDRVPIGRASLKTIMQIIGLYQNNPQHNTVEKIAAEFNLDETRVGHILKYVRVFEVYIPKNNTRPTKAKFGGPKLPRPPMRPQIPSSMRQPDENAKT